MRRSWQKAVIRVWQAVIAVGGVLAIIEFVMNRVEVSGKPQAHGFPLLWVGFWAACGHGLLWRLSELFFWGGSKIGAGAYLLPKGWQAILLSLSMTVPLSIVPAAYHALFGSLVIPQ